MKILVASIASLTLGLIVNGIFIPGEARGGFGGLGGFSGFRQRPNFGGFAHSFNSGGFNHFSNQGQRLGFGQRQFGTGYQNNWNRNGGYPQNSAWGNRNQYGYNQQNGVQNYNWGNTQTNGYPSSSMISNYPASTYGSQGNYGWNNWRHRHNQATSGIAQDYGNIRSDRNNIAQEYQDMRNNPGNAAVDQAQIAQDRSAIQNDYQNIRQGQ